MMLPRQLIRFIDMNPVKFVQLHHFRREFSIENQLNVVGDASHSKNIITREVAKVKSREEKREEELARARASMRRAALGTDHRRNLTSPTAHNDIPSAAVYRNPRLFYQYPLLPP
ncbi:hypothetical protein VNO77_10775 [Canavalia gladiata]|uniref:Uncharacterized protein n=1 Tax=Canavalia gladiata TaxID=3824 RepID=A0AAN9MBB3_CANGL